MTSSKTQASLIDRRRFLEYTWCGVGVSLVRAAARTRNPRVAASRRRSLHARRRLGRSDRRRHRALDAARARAWQSRCARPFVRAGPLACRDRQPHAPCRRPRNRGRGATARTLGARRGERPAAGARLLLSVRCAQRGEPCRPLPYCAARARDAARDAVRLRHLPGLAERLLHRLSRHAPERSRSGVSPRRLHLRVRDRGNFATQCRPSSPREAVT